MNAKKAVVGSLIGGATGALVGKVAGNLSIPDNFVNKGWKVLEDSQVIPHLQNINEAAQTHAGHVGMAIGATVLGAAGAAIGAARKNRNLGRQFDGR
jgi:hypothetical protein